MAKFSGRQVALGVGMEDTRGTVQEATIWIPKTDWSFDDKTNKTRVNSSLGVLDTSEQAHNTLKWAEGDLGAEVRDVGIGYFLKSLFGSVSTDGPDDEAYTHTFTIDQDSAQHESMTFTVKDPNTTEAYANVVLTSIEFSQELENVLTFSATFMGKAADSTTDSTAYTAENKFVKDGLEFKLATNIAGLSGASEVRLKNLTLTLSQNVIPDDALGTVEPLDFDNTYFDVEGSFEKNYEDETYRNYQNNNTTRAASFKWLSDSKIGAGDTYSSLEFKLPNIDFYEWEPNYALDEIASESISFKGNYDLASDTSSVSAILINGSDGTEYNNA
jgi:hypothetical protein